MSNIIKTDYKLLQEDNMLLYYQMLLKDRAIFDPRDGLKPVQRRIIYAMSDLKINSNKAHVKSARVVGDVIGKYHSFGDAAIYGAEVNLAIPWYLSVPLLDPHGNFGSVYGDEAAAMRYTEIRLTKFTEDILLGDLSKDSVDYTPTFDNANTEPVILPAKIPLSIVNGTFGIAAGYAVNVPPHNLNEVLEETIKYLQEDNYQIDLMPDYPTAGVICNSSIVKNGYTTGTSKVVLRGKVEITKDNNILITEIPYMKNLNAIKAELIEAVKAGKIEGIRDLVDNSTGDLIEFTIVIKNGYDAENILNLLFKFTSLQTTLPFNLLGIINDEFIVYNNITEILDDWIEFRISTIKRIKIDLIKQNKFRLHLLEGLIFTFSKENIDLLIETVKKGKGKKIIKAEIEKIFNLDEIQSEYIVEQSLYKINDSERSIFLEERDKLTEINRKTLLYFTEPSTVINHIIEDLKFINDKYKFPRKTVLTDIDHKMSNRELTVADEDFDLICTERYIKKIKGNKVKIQKRSGKGVSLGKVKEDDRIISTISVNSKDNLLFFTNTGKVFSKKVYDIEESSLTSYGKNISSIINNESITNVLSISEDDLTNDNIKILIGTKHNKIKLLETKEFANIFKTGIIATKLQDNDTVIQAEKVDMTEAKSVIACNSFGKCINMSVNDIPTVLRPTFGANIFDSSTMNEDNFIIGIDVIHKETSHMFIISKFGLGKKVSLEQFPIQKRSGKGRIGMNLKEKDFSVSINTIEDNTGDITVITNTSIISMNVSEIPESLRPAFGSSIKKLNKDEYILDSNYL